MRDMFGREITEDQARKIAKRKDPTPAGYAAPPGTGPHGESCKSCANLFRNRQGKVYLKCKLMEYKWTGGRKTDVLASAPACREWQVPF